MLVALKDNCVVSIENGGSINLTVEHDTIVDVADHHKFDIGWIYAAPPGNNQNLLCFFPPKPIDDPANPKAPHVVYAVDSAGNQYEVSEEEKKAMDEGTWQPRQAA